MCLHGNTSSETRPGSVTVSTSFDGYDRLLTYARTGDPSQANACNGLDERVGVTSGSTTHALAYDPDGRLIGEFHLTETQSPMGASAAVEERANFIHKN